MKKEIKILVIVPFPLDDEAIANRSAQVKEVQLSPWVKVDYEAVTISPSYIDSEHDRLFGNIACFQAACTAQERGYDAVCIDTASDSGVEALRSVLDIPVIGPGRTSFTMATMLGRKFSLITVWDAWSPIHQLLVDELGFTDQCVSVRSLGEEPDLVNLVDSDDEQLIDSLEKIARTCIDEDGADVICLASTTMHAAGEKLAQRLEVPVINPGPLTYKMAETLVSLNLSHSRKAYPSPRDPSLKNITWVKK